VFRAWSTTTSSNHPPTPPAFESIAFRFFPKIGNRSQCLSDNHPPGGRKNKPGTEIFNGRGACSLSLLSISSTQEQMVPFDLKREAMVPFYTRSFRCPNRVFGTFPGIKTLQMHRAYAWWQGSRSPAGKPMTAQRVSIQKWYFGLILRWSARSLVRRPAGRFRENIWFSTYPKAGSRPAGTGLSMRSVWRKTHISGLETRFYEKSFPNDLL